MAHFNEKYMMHYHASDAQYWLFYHTNGQQSFIIVPAPINLAIPSQVVLTYAINVTDLHSPDAGRHETFT